MQRTQPTEGYAASQAGADADYAARWGATGAEAAEAAEAGDISLLLEEMRARGVRWLSSGREPELEARVAAHPLPPRELLLALAACAEPRMRDAVIALLVLRPELAAEVPAGMPFSPGRDAPHEDASEQLVVLALAAMYLQERWRSKLEYALGRIGDLALEQWRARGLPAPGDDAGESGLQALAVYERQRRGAAYNFESAWQDQIDHLLTQEWIAGRTPDVSRAREPRSPMPRVPVVGSSARPVRARGLPHTPRGAGGMSMCPPVDRAAIERFLRALGREARQPARVYLVGGTTMVYEGYRARTLDIDVLVEADDPGALGPLLETLRRLKDSLAVNVELASPGDFIPLPAGWRERSIWIGRFGVLDVFHFDLISVALSKIERGTERDIEDVVALVSSGRISTANLDATFAEILPRIATEGVGTMDPDRFASQYAYVQSRLAPSAE